VRTVLHYLIGVLLLFAGVAPAVAGPPYITDDPVPTDFGHYEIFLFDTGTATRDGVGGETGLDFNYGAAPDLQLTAVFPLGYAKAAHGGWTANLGNIELAAKYRFLHEDDVGVDVAVFPRVFLPSGSATVGERHASFLMPIWIGKDFGDWNAFGGGGCVLNRGGDSRDFCLLGAVITRRVSPNLTIGAELYHQAADTRDGHAMTNLGLGAQYDLSEHYHLLGYAGRGLENTHATDRFTWYGSLLITL
jgi:hypothetical protein